MKKQEAVILTEVTHENKGNMDEFRKEFYFLFSKKSRIRLSVILKASLVQEYVDALRENKERLRRCTNPIERDNIVYEIIKDAYKNVPKEEKSYARRSLKGLSRDVTGHLYTWYKEYNSDFEKYWGFIEGSKASIRALECLFNDKDLRKVFEQILDTNKIVCDRDVYNLIKEICFPKLFEGHGDIERYRYLLEKFCMTTESPTWWEKDYEEYVLSQQ